MSIIDVSAICSSDLRGLVNNVLPEVRRESHEVHAINRVLEIFDEGIDRLYRRTAPTRSPHQHRRRAA